jgi:hypothetical protein
LKQLNAKDVQPNYFSINILFSFSFAVAAARA